MISSGSFRASLSLLVFTAISLTAIACSGETSDPFPQTTPTTSSAASPTQSPNLVPISEPTATATSTTIPPTPTATAVPTPTPPVIETSPIPDAVKNASNAFVDIQFDSGGEDGLSIAQGILTSDSGFVLATDEDIARFERRFGVQSTYQAAISIPESIERMYLPIRVVESFPELNLTILELAPGPLRPFVEIAETNTTKPGDQVYSIGIHELARVFGSTAADSSGPLVLGGTVISVELNEGRVEIEHATNLAEMPGAGPLLDSEGRLVGFNIRASRSLGPDGFEPRAFAISVDEFRKVIAQFKR